MFCGLVSGFLILTQPYGIKLQIKSLSSTNSKLTFMREILLSQDRVWGLMSGLSVYQNFVGWDSSVGIATRYALDGLEIESRWRRVFPHPSRPVLGPRSLTCNRHQIFTSGKASKAWR
jgi:hypothetical protein